MSEHSIEERLKRIIIDDLHLEGMNPTEIGSEDPLFGEGLGLDSVDALELVVGMEREFGIKIQSQDVGREAFASVRTLADYVRSRLEAA